MDKDTLQSCLNDIERALAFWYDTNSTLKSEDEANALLYATVERLETSGYDIPETDCLTGLSVEAFINIYGK